MSVFSTSVSPLEKLVLFASFICPLGIAGLLIASV